MDYKACWEYQQRLFDTLLRAKGTPAEGAGYLLLVEHPAVYTLGKSGHAENLLVGEEYLRSIGAEFYHIDRGGDITFHGPGQIVGYPGSSTWSASDFRCATTSTRSRAQSSGR